MNEMNVMKPFKFWVQNVLPVVYDDSLSYYELLCKVVDYINKIIGNETQLGKAMVQLTELVNNFIETADIPEMIEAKLDEMVENGEFDEIISTVVYGASVLKFDTFIQAKASAKLESGMLFITKGYYSVGDGGSGIYGVIEGVSNFSVNLHDNLYAMYIGNVKNVKAFGAYGDGDHDDTSVISYLLNGISNVEVVFPVGEYKILSEISLGNNVKISGDGTLLDRIDNGSATMGLFKITGHDVEITGLTFKGLYGGVSDQPFKDNMYIIFPDSAENVYIGNCKFYNINAHACVRAHGSTNVVIERCIVDKYMHTGFMAYEGCVDFHVRYCDIRHVENMIVPNTYPISLSAGHSNSESFTPTTNASAVGNYIENDIPWWEGIDAHGGYNLLIKDNIIKGTANAIAVFSTQYYECENVKIINNTLYGNRNTSYARDINSDGIYIRCINGLVEGNSIYDPGWQKPASGTSGNGISFTGEYIIIKGNFIDRPRGDGISAMGLSKEIVICDNVIVRKDNSVYTYGISLREFKHMNVLIYDNYIANCLRGIVWNGAYDEDGWYIKGWNNTIRARDFQYYGYAIWDTKYDINPYVGRAGDIIRTYADTQYGSMPMCYICTKTSTSEAAAVWKPIPFPSA